MKTSGRPSPLAVNAQVHGGLWESRLVEFVGPDGLTAANLIRFSVDELRSVGLSPQKASYVADLAAKVNDGTVALPHIGRLSDERVVETLTQVKGIGRWTVQMFLIFSLGRPDVLAHDPLCQHE